MPEEAFEIPWFSREREAILIDPFGAHALYDPTNQNYFITLFTFRLRADDTRELFLLYMKQLHYGKDEKRALTDEERRLLT